MTKRKISCVKQITHELHGVHLRPRLR